MTDCFGQRKHFACICRGGPRQRSVTHLLLTKLLMFASRANTPGGFLMAARVSPWLPTNTDLGSQLDGVAGREQGCTMSLVCDDLGHRKASAAHAASYWITFVGAHHTDRGTGMPSTFAVFRLTIVKRHSAIRSEDPRDARLRESWQHIRLHAPPVQGSTAPSKSARRHDACSIVMNCHPHPPCPSRR